MIKPFLKYFTAILASIWLVLPAPVLAAVSTDPGSAAAAGVQYLANNQQADGSISGFGGESDWTVEAVQAAGQQASSFTHGGSSLLAFVEADAADSSTPTTTVERKIIAIAAAGQDPADFGGVNYDALLDAQHVSGQIGSSTVLNDDIFGIIAIDASHDSSLKPEAQDALDYLLAHQAADGGFSYTTDTSVGSDNNDTASAIIAMYAASDLGLGSPGLDTAQSKALTYLLSTQQADGGFAYDAFSPSDGSSTAWSLMALNEIGSSVASSATSARTWLLNDQNTDGGFSYGAYGTTASDTYTTAHAVIALLGTTWLLNPAPIAIGSVPVSPASPGMGGGTAPSSTATPAAPAPAKHKIYGHFTTGQQFQTTSGTQNTSGNSGKPQVKAAKTVKPSIKAAAPSTANAKSYKLYLIFLLGIIAVIWFMLESRKTRRENT